MHANNRLSIISSERTGMSGEEQKEFDDQIGVTKYQLFIKGVRGETSVIIVHKVRL